jgi:hypothetical protein
MEQHLFTLGAQGPLKPSLTDVPALNGEHAGLQILCWLRFLIQCFSECVHSPTEIEPCALGVTVICLIVNKMF